MNPNLFKILFSLAIIILLSAADTAHDHSQHMHDNTGTVSSTAWLVLLTTGFFTGLSHCAGMCGSLVSAFSAQQAQLKGAVTRPLILYQCGRISTYSLIGIIMATIGSTLQLAALGQGWQVGLSIAIGIMMLLIGLSLTGVFAGLRRYESVVLARWAGTLISRMMVSSHPAAPFGLGMANGMLPCGPVYAMALLAATAQSPLHGGLIMLMFGLGTLPAMMSMGFIFAKLSIGFRSRLYRFAALLIILVGIQQILRGLALNGTVDHFHVGNLMLW